MYLFFSPGQTKTRAIGSDAANATDAAQRAPSYGKAKHCLLPDFPGSAVLARALAYLD